MGLSAHHHGGAAGVRMRPGDCRCSAVRSSVGVAVKEGVAVKITTVDDLAQMTPEERHQHFQDSIVWDLDQVPPEYLARVRERFADRLAEPDLPNAS
jgi:hypothetical protein